MRMCSYLIVGISGVTCGGKTTLANELGNKCKNSYIIHQDNYFYPDDSPNHVMVPNLDHVNYDILSSLDMVRMHQDLLDLIKEKEKICGERKIIIVEGFTILNYEPIAKLCHLKYHILLNKYESQRRRDLRTYDPPDIPGYFEMCVWPEYCKHLKQLQIDKNIVFLNGDDKKLCERVLIDINNIFL